MIGTIFQFGNELVEVRIIDNECFFRTNRFGSQFVTIEGLQLDKRGVVNEHPDLKNDVDWRIKAIERFKIKLKEFRTERSKMNYVVDDLKRYGYVPVYEQRKGFRPRKL